MSSFIQHGFRGGFITALPVKLFYPQYAVLIFWIAFFFGMLNDLIEFVGRIFFGVYLKPLTHNQNSWLSKLLFWCVPYQIHILEDIYWHSLNENDWKRQMNEWVGWFIINPLIVYIIFN